MSLARNERVRAASENEMLAKELAAIVFAPRHAQLERIGRDLDAVREKLARLCPELFDGRAPSGPGSTSLRSPEPVPVSALSGDDPSRGKEP